MISVQVVMRMRVTIASFHRRSQSASSNHRKFKAYEWLVGAYVYATHAWISSADTLIWRFHRAFLRHVMAASQLPELIVAIQDNSIDSSRCTTPRFRSASSALQTIHTSSIFDGGCIKMQWVDKVRQEVRQNDGIENFQNKIPCTDSRLCFTSQNRQKWEPLTM